MSDAKLDTLRKIFWKFQLNPSSRLGGVVVTELGDGQTYGFSNDMGNELFITSVLVWLGCCRSMYACKLVTRQTHYILSKLFLL